MILVTAAHGNQGRVLIPMLHRAGHKVRALRSTPGRDKELRRLGADEVIVGDAADRSVLRRALDGIDTVYHVGPSAHPREREMGFAMVDVARESGVRHLIFNSVLHAIASKLIQHKTKRDVEEYIIESGVNFTILQPSDYMLPALLRSAFESGVFRLSWSLDRLQAMIDLHDLAEIVVKMTEEREKHFGATYELTAPGAYSAHDIAAAIARVTEKPIAVEEVTTEGFRDSFYADESSRNSARYQYDVFRAITVWYGQYDFIGNANVLTWLLGRQPTNLDAFVAREWKRRPVRPD